MPDSFAVRDGRSWGDRRRSVVAFGNTTEQPSIYFWSRVGATQLCVAAHICGRPDLSWRMGEVEASISDRNRPFGETWNAPSVETFARESCTPRSGTDRWSAVGKGIFTTVLSLFTPGGEVVGTQKHMWEMQIKPQRNALVFYGPGDS